MSWNGRRKGSFGRWPRTNDSQRRTRSSLAIESLESRRLLNGAPNGVADFYPLPNSGTIVVGAAVGPPAADYSIPDPADYAREESISVTSGQQQHPGFLTLGSSSDSYGEITVTNPGSGLTINQFLDVGLVGFGRVSVSNGGLLHTTNWTELGQSSGFGVGTVSGAGSRWTNDNFFVVGDNQGRGLLTVENGAVMVNGNHLTVGDDGGEGRLIVTGGSLFTNNNWTRIAPHAGAHGELTVRGLGSAYRNKEWLEIGGINQSAGIVTVMDGGTMDVGMWLDIHPTGRLRGDGNIRSGRFENRGTIEPGAPRGVMTIETGVVQTSSATLEVEIGGTSRGSGYDGLDVKGSFQAGGALVVKFVNGFAPKTGDRFELVRASQVDGAFASLNLQGLASGFSYRLALENGMVTMIATSDGIALPILPAVGVLTNDADPDHEALSAILIEGPAKGTLQLYANGAFRYAAGPEFDGRDAFLYAASDGFFQSPPVLVTLTNLPPVARSDVYHAIEEEVFVSPFSVLANDTDDVPGTVLTARLIQFNSATGTLHFQTDGTFTFTPRPNFFGNTGFLYVASDGLTESELVVGESTIHVEIIVAGRNDPPTAMDDRFETRAGEPLTVVTHRELLHNDVDPDGDRLIVIDVGQPDPEKGTIEIRREMGQVTSFTFTSRPGFQGEVALPYTIRDTAGVESTAPIRIQVTAPNRPPVAERDPVTAIQDETAIINPADLLANDRDPDDDRLSVVAVGNASHGDVSFDDSDNEIRFRPAAGFMGMARFRYTVGDGHGGTDDAFVDVEVKPRVQLVPSRVQGIGSLDGFERFFAFHADNRRGPSAVSGQLTFLDVEQRLFFHATSVFRLEITSDGRRAMFEGEGRRNGRAGYQFKVTIEDRTTLGQRDTFRIQISGPDEFAYDSLDHAEQAGRIDSRGNIRILPAMPRTLVDLLLARQQAFEELGTKPALKGVIRV